jgi:hypothetical protein
MSTTEECEQFYSTFIPEENIFYKFDANKIKMIMERQATFIKKGNFFL